MNRKVMITNNDELQSHYDFDYSRAKPNRFAVRIGQESMMVVLDPDAAEVFPAAESVNETLRALAGVLKNLPVAEPT